MLKQKILIGLSLCVLILSACGGSEETATADLNQIQTAAVGTVLAAQTQTAAAQPTIQLFPTATASATAQPLPTIASSQPTVATLPAPAATRSCYGMAFVSDVTIPDNTPVNPGQTFTKTWKVTNNGSCPWDAGFKFAFTGGDAMGGVTYTLPAAVPVNGSVDLSIAMTAPTNKTGRLQGNWRMSTAAGQFFGDEVFVIVVIGTTTGTPSATATKTPNTPSYP